MSRAARTTALAFACSVAMPALAQTSTGSPPIEPRSEPSYEAETPILLGTFLEPQQAAAPSGRATDVREIAHIVIEAGPTKSRAVSPEPRVEIPRNGE